MDYKQLYEKALNDVVIKSKECMVKDKMIVLMAEVLNDFDYDKQCESCPADICSASVDGTGYTKCIIEYFEKKASEV